MEKMRVRDALEGKLTSSSGSTDLFKSGCRWYFMGGVALHNPLQTYSDLVQ